MKTCYILFCALLIGVVSYGQTITPKGPVTLCAGDSVVLTAPSGNGYQWYYNKALLPGETSATYIAKIAGQYTVAYTDLKRDTTPPVVLNVNPDPNPSFTYTPNSAVCGNTLFTFTANSGASTYKWSFKGSSTSTFTGNPAQIKFDNATGSGDATQLVILTETNSFGCDSSTKQNVLVHQIPDESISSPNSTITQFNGQLVFSSCDGTPTYDFQFLNTSTTFASNTKYSINWGDGKNDTYTNSSWAYNGMIHHTYTTGNYTFTLTTTNADGCTNTTKYGVFIGTNPAGGIITPGNTNICTGTSLRFPVAGTEQNPSGTLYSLVLTDITNTVYSTQNFSQPPPDTVTQLFNKSSCGISDLNNIKNALSIVMTITNPCSVLNDAPSISSVGTIRVSEKPAPDFLITPKPRICVNTSVNILNQGPALNSTTGNSTCLVGVWKISPSTGWNVTSGTMGDDKNSNNPSTWIVGTDQLGLNFTVPGTYTVTLKEGSGSNCGIDSLVKTICVNPKPTASFTLGAITGCAPLKSAVTTTTNTPTCGQYTYQWTVAYTPTAGCVPNKGSITYLSGTSDTSRQPVFQFNDPGVYTFSLLVYGPDSACTAVATTTTPTVTVIGKPNIVSLGIPSAICQGQSINPAPLDSCYINNGTTYSWSFVGGTPTSASVANPGLITYNLSGGYNVTFKVDNNNTCGPTTVTQKLTVNPVPDLSAHGDTSYCVGAASGAYNFASKLAGTTITWTNSNTAIGLGASGTGSIGSFTAKNPGSSPIIATITVLATNINCTTQASFTITVNPVPAAPLVFSPVNYCVGDASSALTATNAATDTLLWYLLSAGGVGDKIAPVPPTNAPLAGKYYYVSQKNIYGCESGRNSIQVVVNDTPHIVSGTFKSPSKCGASDGTITLTGLTPSTTYTITNGGPKLPSPVTTNSAGTLVITGLGGGTYTNIRVINPQGCSSGAFGPLTLSDPTPPPTPAVTSNSPVCEGSTLQLNATSTAVGTVSYSWSGPHGNNFSSTANTSFLAGVTDAGSYTVTTTVNNCSSSASVDVIVNPTPVVTVHTNSPVCQGDTIKLNSSTNAFVGNVTYHWTGPNSYSSAAANPTIPNAIPAQTGSYTLVVTSSPANCASAPVSVNVVVNPTPVIALGKPVNPTNCGSATGSIPLTGLQPISTYIVSYNGPLGPSSQSINSDAAGILTITGLVAGNYTNITVKTTFGCTSNVVGPVTLTDPNPPPAPSASSNSPVCEGGLLQLNASSAATGTVTYSWSGPHGNNFSTLANPSFTAALTDAGSYTVTTTVNSCSSTATLNVVVNPTPVPTAGSNSPVCQGGTLNLTSSTNGFAGNVKYLWTGPSSFTSTVANPQITNAVPTQSGTYTLVVTSTPAGCAALAVKTDVVINPVPVIAVDTSTNPSNCASATGNIVLNGMIPGTNYKTTYDGPKGTISITLASDAGGNLTIPNLVAGTYKNIYVTTNQSCVSNTVGSVVLADPNPPPTPTAGSNSPVCEGKPLQLTASTTATGAVTYSWSGPHGNNFSTLASPSPFPAALTDGGTYTVTTTVNSCSSSSTVNVVVNPTPVPTAGSNSPVCQGGTLTLTSSTNGFAGNVNYSWTGPNSYTSAVSNPQIGNAVPGQSGTYVLVVTSTPAGCASLPVNTIVLVNPVPVIAVASSANPLNCASATGNIVLSGLVAATSYIVGYNGPLGTKNIPLTADAAGNITINGLVAGLYTNINVTTSAGCTSNIVGPLTLSDPNPPAAPTVSSNSPVCEGSQLQLSASSSASGTITFAWSGPCITAADKNNPNQSFTATLNCAGTYTVTATVNNCTSQPAPLPIIVNPTPVPTATSNSPVCEGGTVTLKSSTNGFAGNVNYAWTGPNSYTSTIANPQITNAVPTQSGTYTLVVTSTPAGCASLPVNTSVVVNPVPVISVLSYANPINCGSATGNIVLGGLVPGAVYTVTYTGPLGPASRSITADAAGDITMTGLVAGTYINIGVTTAKNCTSNTVGPVTLTDPNPPAAPIATSNGPICDGGVLNLFASPTVPSGVYSWSGPCITPANANLQNPSFNATVACTGTYFVTVTTNNCTSLPGSVSVVVNANAAVPTANANTPVCSGSMLNLTASSTPVGTGPITYFWTGPCITASNSASQNPSFPAALSCAGTYCVTAFNAGCPSPSQGCVNVTVNPTPAITSDYKNPTSCGTNTGSITLYGLLSGVAYILEYDYNGVPQPKQYPRFTNPSGDIVIDNLPAGIYKNIRVTTPAGCTSNIIGPDTLVNLAPLVPVAKSNGPLCVGSTLNLTSFVAPLLGTVTYTWAGPGAVNLLPSNNVQNPTIPVTTMADSGLYTVTATVNGCSVSASVNVVVNSKSIGGHTFNDTTVCYGTNTGTIHLSGNNGQVTNWEYSTDNGVNWLVINNTTSSQVFTNLTTTTWYRAVVQNSACEAVHSDSAVITVINAVPKAYAGPDQILCNQQSVNLAATKALIGTGLWTQSAGPTTNITPVNAPNATVTPLVPGTYDFLWTVTGPAGCGSSSAQVQIINRPTVTKADAGPEQDMCNFTKTTTLNLAANQNATRPFEHGLWAIIIQPKNGSGTFSDATSPTSTFTFSQPGIYKLAWTISNDVGAACGTSTDTLLINIANPPVAAFNVNPTGLCVGQLVTVTNTSVNTNVYNWHWGDGQASTFVSGNHSYTLAAQYTITLIAQNILPTATCIDSAKQTVTVADVIPAVINITPGNACIPYNLQADALGATGASLIEWRVFDNAVSPYMFYSTGASASHQFDFAGTDSIRLIVHNQGICTDSALYKFTVYSVPVTTFAPPTFSTCNHDTTVVFQATTTYTGSDPVNYKWFVNDQLSGNSNPFNYTFNTPASSTSPVEYTIKLLAQNTGNCGDSSTSQTVTVMPLPAAGIHVAPSLIQQEPDYTFTFTDTTAADQFKIDKWYMGDRNNQTRSGTEVKYQYSDSGSYFVKLLATDFSTGCTNTDTVTVSILYVPGYLQVADAFCPGCSKDELRTFLPLGKGLRYYHLRIYTIWGKLIFETTLLNADGSPAEAWRGDDHGQPVQQGAYRWEIEARFINGTEWKGMLYPNNSQRVKSGFITIIK